MMTRRWCAAAVLSLMACSEPPKAAREDCGDELCIEGQRCEPSTLRCVTNEVPKLSLIAPTTVVSAERFELTGSVTDDTAGAVLEWRDGMGEWQSAELSSEGTFSISVPARELDSEEMNLTVRVGDGTNRVEKTARAVVDRIAPQLELKSPAEGTTSGGSSVTISVIAQDGSEALEELRIGDQNFTAPRTGTELSASLPIPPDDLQALQVTVVAKDVYGNRATRTFAVQVDGEGPALRFVSPSAQTPTLTAASFRVEVEAMDLSAVQSVRLAMNDGGYVSGSASDGGAWSAEFALPDAEQQLTFRVAAVDGAGNQTTAVSAPVRLDRVAPTITLTGPGVGTIHNSAFPVTAQVSGDAVSVTATFAGSTIALFRTMGDRWEGQMPLTGPRDYEEHQITAIAADAAGNQGPSAPLGVFIDTVAPRLNFTTPTANAKLNRTNFSGTEVVRVAWQVQDADPLAATIRVDGVPSTTNEVQVMTLPSDDGRVISKTVMVADRRGNVASGTLSFSVDRVAPTVVAWLPAANARNVEPRTTTVSFSERVSGPTSASAALTSLTGSWNAAHTSWTCDPLAPYQVITATLSDLTDDSGNPVEVSTRKFHTAAAVPPSGLVLSRNVTAFAVTSDSDGLATIAVTTSPGGYKVFRLSPTGLVESPSLTDPNGGQFSLNSSLSVDPTTLVATHRVGSARYGGMGTGPLVPIGLVRHAITDGVAMAMAMGSTTSAPGALVSQGAFSGETDGAPFALVDDSTYLRGAVSRSLPSPGHLVVAQSNYTWAAFSASSTALRWSRFLCIPGFFEPTCTAFAFSAASVDPVEVRAAISPDSRCLVATWKSGSTQFAAFQPLARCDELRLIGTPEHPSCQTNQTLTAVAMKLKVAPFSSNNQATLLGAWESNGIALGKMDSSAACTNAFTAVGSPLTEPATAYAPVQLGNKPALLYTDASRNLKLYVP